MVKTAAEALQQQQQQAAFAKNNRMPTAFEDRLYKVCSAIPKGKVSSYGALAKVLHSSPRAVGQALRRNPYAPQVPCHRVITSSLELGGFSGTWGETPETSKKRKLLAGEGVAFTGNRLADRSLCYLTAQQLAPLCQEASA